MDKEERGKRKEKGKGGKIKKKKVRLTCGTCTWVVGIEVHIKYGWVRRNWI
jgi:hypothetical protein